MIARSAAAEQCALVSCTTFHCWLPQSTHWANKTEADQTTNKIEADQTTNKIEADQTNGVVESVAKAGRPQILEAQSQEAEESASRNVRMTPIVPRSVWASPKSTDDSTIAASMPTVLAPNMSLIRSGK